MICDAHIHLLPEMDNGPRSLEESAAMLKIMQENGVKRAVLSPHFYPEEETVAHFLLRRASAYKSLCTLHSKIQFVLSAQVSLCAGAAKIPNITSLCIPNTPYLPISLPMNALDGNAVRELCHLLHKRQIKPIVCETERYFILYGKQDYEKLTSLPYCAFCFSYPVMKDKDIVSEILRLRVTGKPVLLASNAHNAYDRPPYNQQYRNLRGKKEGPALEDLLFADTNRYLLAAFD